MMKKENNNVVEKPFAITSIANSEMGDWIRLQEGITEWATTNWVGGNARRHIGIQDVYAYNINTFDKDPDAVLSRYKTIYNLTEHDFCTIAFALYGRKRISEGKEWIE